MLLVKSERSYSIGEKEFLLSVIILGGTWNIEVFSWGYAKKKITRETIWN